ncbi:MAG: hypothetical protein WCY30_00065 [Candidatus Neomarinimicrobiota bacterium]|jgi:hypothetical protein
MTEMQNEIGTLAEWDPMSGRIYKDVESNAFITASTVGILASNYSKYGMPAIETATLIGLIQDWNITQALQAPQIFECGSNGRYTLSTGRVAGSAALSRVIYHGSNLLFLLYAGQTGLQQTKYPINSLGDIAGYGIKEGDLFTSGFAINLASSVFINPLGLFFVFRQAGAKAGKGGLTSAFFLEDAHIVNHGIGASAGAPYVGEQVQLTFEAAYPVQVGEYADSWPSAPGK